MAATIEQLAHRIVPGALIGDRAAADRALRRHNVVGVFRDVSDARDAIARVEDVAGDGSHVQFVSFDVSTRDDRRPDAGGVAGEPGGQGGAGAIDPEGVVGVAGRRIAIGGVIGGVVGGLAVAAIVLAVTQDAGVALAAGVGAAMILGVIGALIAGFAKFGAGDAWRQTFQPGEPPVSLVAVLTDDRDVVQPAAEVLRAHGASSVEIRDGDGEVVRS
jgi:hypothetical protein